MAKSKKVVKSGRTKKQKGGFGQYLSGLFGFSSSSGQSQNQNQNQNQSQNQSQNQNQNQNSVEEKVDANQSFVGGKTKKKHHKRKGKK